MILDDPGWSLFTFKTCLNKKQIIVISDMIVVMIQVPSAIKLLTFNVDQDIDMSYLTIECDITNDSRWQVV